MKRNAVAAIWDAMQMPMYEPPDLDEDTRAEMRRVFFAGADQMFIYLFGDREHRSVEQLQEIDRELKEWRANLANEMRAFAARQVRKARHAGGKPQ